jgi:hypothetical protein
MPKKEKKNEFFCFFFYLRRLYRIHLLTSRELSLKLFFIRVCVYYIYSRLTTDRERRGEKEEEERKRFFLNHFFERRTCTTHLLY